LTVDPNVGVAESAPVAREMVAPFPSVRFDPFVKVPLLSVNVPATVNDAPSVIPAARLIVKLLRPPLTAGRVVAAPEPNTRLEVAPPCKLPLVTAIRPFRVKVFAPMASV
jgi:hypothetical protein